MTRVVLVLLGVLLGALPARALVAELSQREIAVSTGFTGAELIVYGAKDSIPADIVVAVRGPQTPVVVRQRTRVAGIWLNGASARFDTAPGYYAIASTRPLAELLPEAERRRLRLGLDLLPLRASEPDPGDGFRNALIELKLDRGLYRQAETGVSVTGERLFATRILLPPTVPPGLYLVDVLGVQGGRVVASRDLTFTVRRVGTSAEIWRFAHAHPWLYGFAAVVAAAVVGWAGSVVFRRG